MKKHKNNIFATLILIISLFTLVSCNKEKNLDYIYVGVYIDILEVEEISFNDRNLKLYIDTTNNNTLVSENKIYEYQITPNPARRIYEVNGVKVYYLASRYEITCDLKEVDIYPIVFKNGTYEILTNDVKTIELEKNENKVATFNKEYKFDDTDYNFSASITICKK